MARMTLDLAFDPETNLEPVLHHLRAGGLIAYPTETVYGLGGVCTPDSVAEVFRVKRREESKPLLALVSSMEGLVDLRWSHAARALAEVFWPGSVTLVLPDPLGIFPPGVRSESTGAVGVRITPHPLAARLVAALGAPLTSTSLNLHGQPPAASGVEAARVLDQLGREDVWLLDGGPLPSSDPSTVIDCTGADPVVLREGSVPIHRLRCVIPEIHGRVER
jgi:L-threonylcarbamoyladenylate synthase